MTQQQGLWLKQAASDYAMIGRLKGSPECHRVHYLQMATEKLAKVYHCRHGPPSSLSHHVLEQFLRSIEIRADFHELFGYSRANSFALVWPKILALAIEIQNLAPAGNTGANPEYPFPRAAPTTAPVDHPFPQWKDWNETNAGRRLRHFVENLLKDYTTIFP